MGLVITHSLTYNTEISVTPADAAQAITASPTNAVRMDSVTAAFLLNTGLTTQIAIIRDLAGVDRAILVTPGESFELRPNDAFLRATGAGGPTGAGPWKILL